MRKSTLLIVLGVCLFLCLPLFSTAAYIITYFLPRKYTSVVTIQIEVARNAKRPGASAGPADYEIADRTFVADQAQALRSQPLLDSVVDELDLADKWSAGLHAKLSKEEAFEKLLKMDVVIQKPDTDLLDISVTSFDRQEAADIANTIAIIYQKRLHDDQQQQITNTLSELKAEIDKQHVKVGQANAGSSDSIAAEKLLDDAEQHYEAENRRLTIGSLAPFIVIWNRAEPSRGPSSPNVTAILVVSFGLGFLCAALGMVPLYFGVRLKMKEPPPIPNAARDKAAPRRESGWQTEI